MSLKMLTEASQSQRTPRDVYVLGPISGGFSLRITSPMLELHEAKALS